MISFSRKGRDAGCLMNPLASILPPGPTHWSGVHADPDAGGEPVGPSMVGERPLDRHRARDRLPRSVESDEAPEFDVETRAVEGQAARVLLDASQDADLLVVGSRGLGGFRELLLGSVSQQCAHHATCPVVIVRHTGDQH